VRVDLLHRTAGNLLELVLFDDDRFDRQPGLKLDLIESVQVRRIGDADEQPLAALDERQYPVFLQQLVGNELDHFQVELDGVEVQERHAEFLRRRYGDVPRIRETCLHEIRYQIGLRFLRIRNGLQHGCFVQEALLDQAQGQTLERKPLLSERNWISHGSTETRGNSRN